LTGPKSITSPAFHAGKTGRGEGLEIDAPDLEGIDELLDARNHKAHQRIWGRNPVRHIAQDDARTGGRAECHRVLCRAGQKVEAEDVTVKEIRARFPSCAGRIGLT
jgi:hypothetical protein